MYQLDPTTIATRLTLPSWWVRAHDAAMLATSGQQSAMEQVAAAGLAPALTPLELNALAVIIAGFQEQMLVGKKSTLVVRSEEHLKHASTAARSRRFSFEKVMQLLPGVRILRPLGDGSLDSQRLFSHDGWTIGEEAFELELTPARLGPELLLGYSDAHLDLIRLAKGEVEGNELIGSLPPLAIWRSIWLDLQSVEQAVFMRMERSMQWEFHWLQLEGVFGVPLTALFDGLDERDDSESRSLLERRLRLAARLGRKLCSHGFLSQTVDGQFLALADEDTHGVLHLVWQVARERLALDAVSDYRAAVCGYMLMQRHAEQLEALLRVLLPEAPGAAAMQAARTLWGGIAGVSLAKDELSSLCYKPGQILLPQALFLEFSLRRRFESDFPLPQALLSGIIADLTDPKAKANDGERFMHFARAASEAPELTQMLATLPFASLTSDISKADVNLKSRLADLLRPPVAANFSSSKTETSAAQVMTSANASVAAEPTEDHLPELAELTKDKKGASSPAGAAVSGALASRLRRIAAEELQRMRSIYPDRYQDLKKAYLGSLDDVGRRLILDVQRRMQPTMFEEHLRQRLVRFMVENPGAWRASKPASMTAPSVSQ